MNKRLTVFQQVLLNMAKEYGEISLKDVKNQHDVTEWTIRMNLNKLESDGLLERTHERKLQFKIN